MFEFVGILVFFLVEIDEVMSNAILGFRIHVPRNLEGVTRDVTYFDVVWDWKLLHLCNPTILWFIPCMEKKQICSVKDPFDQCFVCSSTSTSLNSLSQGLTGGPQQPLGYSYTSLDVSDGKHWKGMKFLRWISTNNMAHRVDGITPVCACRLTGQSTWSYRVLQGSVKTPAMPTVNTMAPFISVSHLNTSRNHIHP